MRENSERIAHGLASAGYPGFAHCSMSANIIAEEVLCDALLQTNLDCRVIEGLPWLIWKLWATDFSPVIAFATFHNVQNRLGFLVSLARQLSEQGNNTDRTAKLIAVEGQLITRRLTKEDFFFREVQQPLEYEYLRKVRSSVAKVWRLVTDLKVEHLDYEAWFEES